MNVKELEKAIARHRELYYNQSEPEVTDSQYDAMVDELRGLDPRNPLLTAVGAVASYGRKVRHASAMGSLDKQSDVEVLRAWCRSVNPGGGFILTPKIDGLAVRLNYVEGVLVEAATRGDGEVGQDILDNVRVIDDIPKKLASGATCEVRGEVYMPRSVFRRLNADPALLKKFANPRNAASGSLLAKDPAITKARSLGFLSYDVIDSSAGFDGEIAKFMRFSLQMPEFHVVDSRHVEEGGLAESLAEWNLKRKTLDYDIDGMVLAVEKAVVQEALGYTGKNPNFKIAFKFPPAKARTVVQAIDWTVGRTGRITPLARIEPVLVDGSTVSNVTLHNDKRVAELGILVGSEIEIEKCGDIIPGVVRVLSDSHGSYSLPPAQCPSCGTGLVRDENDSLVCAGGSCPAQLSGRVLHYIDRMGIMGVGEGIVEKLCESGLVTRISDLYYMNDADLERVLPGKRLPIKVQEAILTVNEIPLATFLSAIGIHGLGRTTSKTIARSLKTAAKVFGGIGTISLTVLDGIGFDTARSISEGLFDFVNSAEYARIAAVIDIMDEKVVTGGASGIAGKSFCMTGALLSGKTRSQYAAEIENAGGTVKSSVGRGLDYLIMADPTSGSAKATKAKQLGVQCVSEAMVDAMMKG
jgi:DNA ligase (NAD+)